MLRTDAGFTLVELMVAMLVTVVVLGLIMAPFVTVTNVAGQVQSSSNATAQARTAVDDLQAAVTSASQICLPTTLDSSGQTASAGYAVRVETTAFGVTNWEQWWLDTTTSQLEAQTWPTVSAPGSSWRIVATGVDAIGSGAPFVLVPPGSTTDPPGANTPGVLYLAVQAQSGVKATTSTSQIRSAIAALNTAYVSGSATCMEQG